MTAEEHISAAEALLEPVANPDYVNSTYLLDKAKTHLAIAKLKLAIQGPRFPLAEEDGPQTRPAHPYIPWDG